MTHPVVTIIAQGAMGAAVGRCLVDHGARVLTSLAGRSRASAARAKEARMEPVSDEQAVTADYFLSIVPPGEALAVARRFAPHLERTNRKPIFVDCNAVNPRTAAEVAAVIDGTGTPFVDAGIIGAPPREGCAGPTFYASGREATRFAELSRYGLDIRVVDERIGTASAIKMSYAGITKGFTALGALMMLAATRAGVAEALHRELSRSQPQLLAWLTRQVPGMYSKAYRWVAEMEEIAAFAGEDPCARQTFEANAKLYERLAADFASSQEETRALMAFLAGGGGK
jgi:3-hydroxyisobutyrate dehydrogenase-like beta-hydroxyacid dehydrogenase